MASSFLVSPPPIDAKLLASLDTPDYAATPFAAREAALQRATEPSESTPINRYWRIDFAKVDLGLDAARPVASATYEITPETRAQGVVFCTLAAAATTHGDLLAAHFNSLIPASESRFTAIAAGLEQGGYFLYVPAGVKAVHALRMHGEIAAGSRFCPRNVVIIEAGAQATLHEEYRAANSGLANSGAAHAGDAALSLATLVCGTTELFVADDAHYTTMTEQYLDPSAQIFMTRRSRVGVRAKVRVAIAELGGALIRSELEAHLCGAEADANITALFFPSQTQHVDVKSEVLHAVGHTTSTTLVKAAATEAGQGRFAGNIRIEVGAHGSSAHLRDDALLLSPDAHVDAIPALEIAANDVQAFHGATVGAIDDEIRFYVTSRGIDPEEAERMIALAFFDNALQKFDDVEMRERVTEQLRRRVSTAIRGH